VPASGRATARAQGKVCELLGLCPPQTGTAQKKVCSLSTLSIPSDVSTASRPAWPRLGLGCSRIGSFSSPHSVADSIALIRRAFELGVTLFDTANIYGQGDSESAIGRALRGHRDEAVIVTKAGNAFSARMALMRPLKPLLWPLMRARRGAFITAARQGALRQDWRPRTLIAALDASLARLKTDRVDAFLLHSPSGAVIAAEETGKVLERVLSSGRALRVGVSCDNMVAFDAALVLPATSVLELPWNMIVALDGDPRVAGMQRRKVAVLAREVIVGQRGMRPVEAIARAAASPLVTTTLVGTASPAHLAEAVAALK
jgi:aryl-alcohol dehydrogenase-like predicted oxidoreductase